MARALNTDYLQSFAFSVRDVSPRGNGAGDPFDYNGGEENGVGFTSVSGLSVSGETYQWFEGTFPFARTMLRRATVSPVVLRRGMAARDSDFYNWFHACLYGNINARKTLMVTMNFRDGTPAKAWVLHECIPTRVGATPDLDGNTGEVAIAEIEVQPTYIEELDISSSE